MDWQSKGCIHPDCVSQSAEGPQTGGGGSQLEEGAGSEVLTQMEVLAGKIDANIKPNLCY